MCRSACANHCRTGTVFLQAEHITEFPFCSAKVFVFKSFRSLTRARFCILSNKVSIYTQGASGAANVLVHGPISKQVFMFPALLKHELMRKQLFALTKLCNWFFCVATFVGAVQSMQVHSLAILVSFPTFNNIVSKKNVRHDCFLILVLPVRMDVHLMPLNLQVLQFLSAHCHPQQIEVYAY